MGIKTSIIELSEEDAKAFLMFRKYYAEFALLVDNRVFDLKHGSAEIHFDRNGHIDSIDLHAKVFKKINLTSATVAIVKDVV